jgi:cytochrome c peroxidase
LPRQLAVSGDGNTLYIAAKGSDKVGVFAVAELENDSFVPDSADHVQVSGGGPAGLVLDEARGRLYVTTRFDNGLSIVDTASKQETAHILLANPEPLSIRSGRRFLYDAGTTSSNGEAACASCHVDGDLDSLAWDLGNPDDSVLNNPLDFTLGPAGSPDFHPLKGPMTTQTLRGMDGHGSMHWRGDRTFGNEEANAPPDGGAYNEFEAFKKFAGAFESLLGRATAATTAEMEAFADFILQVQPPPSPIRNLDDSLTAMQAAGETFYFNSIVDTQTCNTCHVLQPGQGFFGTDGRASFEGEPQHMKIPQLRNMYSKVGMFGMPNVAFFNGGNNAHQGDQIRGFGFLHDGSTDTLLRFLNASLFNFPGGDAQRKEVEQFLFAFDSNLKPVVGQQITLTDSNAATVGARVTLLIDRADAGDADLVVKGAIGGEARGWHMLPGKTFQSDRAGETPLSDAALRALAQTAGQPLTYTAVPPGSGVRIGIDRDEDGVLDNDDNCPAESDPDQTDTDADGDGNPCDADDDNDGLSDTFEAALLTDPLLTDTDGDGLTDGAEVGYDGDYSQYTPGQDTNPLVTDTDADGLPDATDPIPLTVNLGDGDLAPWNAPDGAINAADFLLAQQIVLGLRVAGEVQLAHGDLFPSGAPDGAITLQDLILLGQQIVP